MEHVRDGEVPVQRVVLGDVSDPGQRPRRVGVRGFAEDRHLALGGLEQPDDHFQQGGRSTRFIHEDLVGVKCSWKRGCFRSHWWMAGVSWVE